MKLKKIIIHNLEKEQQALPTLGLAKKELDITSIHENFMDEVKNVYYKKSNPQYGAFDPAKDSFPFQNFLNDYLSGSITFFQFTEKAAKHFEKVIQDETQATGGYVLFCHFETTEDFIAVIMMNDKQSYIINDNLDINENARLDIEKLDVANFTNCSKLSEGDDVYLSFTRGKKGVSNYFKRFIGCTDYTSVKENAEKLKIALNNYLIENGIDKSQKEEIKTLVSDYCSGQLRKNEDISLAWRNL